jgi:hypothetical protein
VGAARRSRARPARTVSVAALRQLRYLAGTAARWALDTKTQDAEVFVKFMHDEYFPSVHNGPTRVGQVSDLALLQEEPEGKTPGCSFFLHVAWSGLRSGGIRIDDEAVPKKFESFKARIKRLGAYAEAAAWHHEVASGESLAAEG